MPVSGQFTFDGTGTGGAEITVLDEGTSPPTVVGTTTSNSDGSWSVDMSGDTTVEALCVYQDPDTGDIYTTKNKPYVDHQPTWTMVEDHESGTENYTGATGTFDVLQDSTLEGSYLLSSTSTFAGVAHDTDVSSRGDVYRGLIYSTGSSGQSIGGSLAVGTVDGSNPYNGSYTAWLQWHNDLLRLNKETSSGRTVLNDTSVSLSHNTVYELEFDYGPTGETDNLTARLLDSTGTELASVSASDDEYGDGPPGWIVMNQDAAIYYDDMRKQ